MYAFASFTSEKVFTNLDISARSDCVCHQLDLSEMLAVGTNLVSDLFGHLAQWTWNRWRLDYIPQAARKRQYKEYNKIESAP
jgi:hypothetical protein